MKHTPWTIESLARFFRITDNADCYDSFWWRANEPQYEPFKLLVNCNDLFYWASADCEEITPDNLDILEQAFKDIKPFYDLWAKSFKSGKGDKVPYVPMDLAPLLFCARVRNMRPQGAYYQDFPPGVDVLFDEAGPERDSKELSNTPRRGHK